MDNKNEMVLISRNANDYIGGLYEASKITGVHWSNCSGGVHRIQSGKSLYGYIPYEDAAEIVSCSGQHSRYNNEAKVCITAVSNEDRPAYYRLVEQADERGKCGIADGCPNGAPSATQRIRQIVGQQGEISRGELKARMLEEGYSKEVIPLAIKNLHLQNVLLLIGDSRSPKQFIRFR